MQAVKLKPEELLLEPVKSDWLLLCRVLPKGLPNPREEPKAEKEMYSRKITKISQGTFLKKKIETYFDETLTIMYYWR